MNRLFQFLQYTQKVFALNPLLRRLRDGRCDPLIPLGPVLRCLILGVVVRIGSYLDLARQTQTRRRWRHLCHLKAAMSHETFGYVTERMKPEDWRQNQAAILKRLKRNKALERCKIKGLLWVSLAANEHFKSRSRTCPRCCQRRVEVTDADGHKTTVLEFYHRYVFAQINGPHFSVLLDVEPILPGEDECAAALRLLGRLRRLYGPRFFDGITADAWYAKGPFLRAVTKLGWLWIVVLKREDMDVYQEAHRLSHGEPPAATFRDEDRKRQVDLWQVKDLEFSQEYGETVRVVRSEERWLEHRVAAGRQQTQPRASRWVWAASAALDGYGPELVYEAGHRRWGIENHGFNERTQRYHLEHCYHHDPTAMLVQMLILIFGFTLFTAFALHSQLVRWGELSLKALAHELDLALEQDLPWELWFAAG